MNGYLKQSTASQTRTIGPFIDDTDFKTLENALSIANTDVIIKKNGAASGTKNSGGATADGSGGLYHLTWDATDTNTVGELSFSVKVAGALVVFGTYTVLEEAVYDMLFGASAIGYIADQPVNTTKIGGTTQTARDIGASVLLSSGTGAGQISLSSGLVTLAGVTHTGAVIPTVTTVTNQLTAAQIATGVWQDATASDFTAASSIGKSLYTSGNAPGAASGLALVGSNMGTVSSVTGAVGSVTGNVGGNVSGSVGSVVGAVGSVTATVNADVVKVNGSTITGSGTLADPWGP